MVMYQVWAVCNACGDNHTVGTTVSYPVSSSNKVSHEQSIARALSNKNPPAKISRDKDIRFYCPKLEDTTPTTMIKIFLVPGR